MTRIQAGIQVHENFENCFLGFFGFKVEFQNGSRKKVAVEKSSPEIV